VRKGNAHHRYLEVSAARLKHRHVRQRRVANPRFDRLPHILVRHVGPLDAGVALDQFTLALLGLVSLPYGEAAHLLGKPVPGLASGRSTPNNDLLVLVVDGPSELLRWCQAPCSVMPLMSNPTT
jgi:hypothetical protein